MFGQVSQKGALTKRLSTADGNALGIRVGIQQTSKGLKAEFILGVGIVPVRGNAAWTAAATAMKPEQPAARRPQQAAGIIAQPVVTQAGHLHFSVLLSKPRCSLPTLGPLVHNRCQFCAE